MFALIAAAALSSSPVAIDKPIRWHVEASGDTSRLYSADVYNHPTIKPKKKKIALRIIPEFKPTPAVHNGKNVLAFIPKDNGLDKIIARVKRENGLTTKVKS